MSRSTRPTSTRTASRPARRTTSRATRAARDVARGAREAQARRARERRAHRGHVVADHRRRRRGAADDGRAGAASSACGRGPASSTSASSASTRCSCSPARSTRPAACSSAPASRSTTSTSIEINEAFASVVLAWERELKPDMAQGEPERRRDRARPPRRRDRRAARHDRAARARAHRRHATRSSRCAAAAGSARGTILERVVDRWRRAPGRSSSPTRSAARARARRSFRGAAAASSRVDDVALGRLGCARGRPRKPGRLSRGRVAGFPTAGPEMVLGVTDSRLVVWRISFWLSRPIELSGDIPIDTSGRRRRPSSRAAHRCRVRAQQRQHHRGRGIPRLAACAISPPQPVRVERR